MVFLLPGAAQGEHKPGVCKTGSSGGRGGAEGGARPAAPRSPELQWPRRPGRRRRRQQRGGDSKWGPRSAQTWPPTSPQASGRPLGPRSRRPAPRALLAAALWSLSARRLLPTLLSFNPFLSFYLPSSPDSRPLLVDSLRLDRASWVWGSWVWTSQAKGSRRWLTPGPDWGARGRAVHYLDAAPAVASGRRSVFPSNAVP